MKSCWEYKTASEVHVLIKSGAFSRQCGNADGTQRIISRYAIKIYSGVTDTTPRRMRLYESFWLKEIDGFYARQIEAGLQKLVLRRLEPENLTNALELVLEGMLNEE